MDGSSIGSVWAYDPGWGLEGYCYDAVSSAPYTIWQADYCGISWGFTQECANNYYWDGFYDFSLTCPSYEENGRAVVLGDCYCEDYSASRLGCFEIFDFSHPFFAGTGASGKGGLVNTTIGATPFYTNGSNPVEVTLLENQSQLITWWVNATGSEGKYEFYTYTNRSGVLNETVHYNVSIVGYPTVNFTSNSDFNRTYGRDSVFVNVSGSSTGNVSTLIDFNNSILGWWTMDDVSGSTVIDYMNKNNGTLVGGASQVSGKMGKAMSMAGEAAVNLGDRDLTDQFTIVGWMKGSTGDFDNAYPYSGLIEKSSSYLIECDFGGIRVDTFGLSDTSYRVAGACPSSDEGGWHQWATTYNGTRLSIYKDGVFVGSEDKTGTLTQNNNNAYLGYGIGSNTKFNGSIDDVIILNRSLSADEVSALYGNTSVKYAARNFTGLSDGEYNVTGYAQSSAGRISSTGSRIVTLDRVAPRVQFVSPTPQNGNVSNKDSIYVNVTSSDVRGNVSTFVDLNNSLIGWWRFDDVNGSGSLTDRGSLNRTMGLQNYSDVGIDAGKSYFIDNATFGRGYRFVETVQNGNGNYFMTSRANNCDYANLDCGSKTISLWVRPVSGGYNGMILGTMYATLETQSTGGWHLRMNSDTTMSFNWRDDSQEFTTSYDSVAATVTSGQWHHVLILANNTYVGFYVDGVLVDSEINFGGFGEAKGNYQNDNLMLGGGYNVSYLYGYNGEMDDVMIFNRSLTVAEINSLYANSSSRYLDVNLSSLRGGRYNVTVYAQDSSGNLNQTESRNITIVTPPSIFVDYPYNGSTVSVSSGLTLNYTYLGGGVEADACWYSINGGSNVTVPGCIDTTINVNQGWSNVTVYANDSQGQLASNVTTFFVDSIYPKLFVDEPFDVAYSNGTDVTVDISTPEGATGSLVSNLDNGLVSWWTFDSYNSTHVFDYMGRKNGNLTGGARIISNGHRASALNNSDSANVMLIPGTIDLSTNWTFASWFWYPIEEVTHYRTLIRGAAGDHQILVQVNNYNLGAYDNVGGTNFRDSGYDINVLSTGWHQIVAMQNASGIYYYMDGVRVGAILGYTSTTDIYSVGGLFNPGQEWGTIDDAMVFNRSLTASEILGLYNATRVNYNTTLATGNHTYQAFAQDSSGNINASTVFGFEVDPTIPFVGFNLTTPSDGTQQPETYIDVGMSVADQYGSYSFVDLDSSLVGYWRGEDGANDTTGRNNGSFGGGAGITRNGKFGKAFTFDGNGDYVNITGFGSVAPTSEVAISLWVYAPLAHQNLALILNPDSGLNRIGFSPCYGDGNTYWDFGSIPGGGRLSYTSPSDCTDRWNHYVLLSSSSSNSMQIYRNGILEASSGTHSNFTSGTYALVFGGDRSSYWFNGSFDEVMVFNRTLSTSEIEQLYNASKGYYMNRFSNLEDPATHTIKGYTVDTAGNINSTEERSVYVDSTLTNVCRTLGEANTVYTLLGNVTATNANCMVVGAHNVTLDLNGYYILGNSSNTNGVLNSQYDNFTLKNGYINGFTYQFYSTGITNKSNITNMTFSNAISSGIYATLYNSSISNVTFRNTPYGIALGGNYTNLTNFYSLNSSYGVDNAGAYFSGLVNGLVDGGVITNNGYGRGIYIYDSSVVSTGSVFKNVNISSAEIGVSVRGAGLFTEGSSFENISILGSSKTDYYLYNSSLEGYDFVGDSLVIENGYGAVNYTNSTIYANGTNMSGIFEITNNNVFVNASRDLAFNTTANITLKGLVVPFAEARVDFEDDGSFIDCPLEICTNLSYADSIFIYNVTHFTSYSSEDFNNVPDTPPFVYLNTSGGENISSESLICNTHTSDPDGDTLTVSVDWYVNGGYNQTRNYTVANATNFSAVLTHGNTTKTDVWSCAVKFIDDQDESPWVNSSNLTIVNDIPDVVIEYPGNWSSITNRTPTFNWSVIDGDEKDTITYDFRINETKFAGAATCVGLDDALDGISQNYYTPASILDCLYDNGYFYNWSVRAYDGEEYGEWTHAYVNITADTTITLTNDVINFGYLWPTNSTDTTSGLDPLVVQNDGNAIVNVSINSSALWFTELLDSQYYQFKIDNVTGESNAFNWTGSITSWFNMPITGDVIAIDQLNYTDSKDSVEVDVRLEVPPNEPPGAKISTIVFTSRLDE
jgi:hypothetical protein